MNKIIVMRQYTSGVELVAYNGMVFMGDVFFELSEDDTAQEILSKKPTWNQNWNEIKASIKEGHSDEFDFDKDDVVSDLVAEFAYRYLEQKGRDYYICDILIKTKVTQIVFDYFGIISKDGKDEKIEQMVIESNDPFWSLEYCEIFGEVPQLKEILKESGDAEWISRYCVYVKDDPDMVKALKDTGDNQWMEYYLQNKEVA